VKVEEFSVPAAGDRDGARVDDTPVTILEHSPAARGLAPMLPLHFYPASACKLSGNKMRAELGAATRTLAA
jgi:hypothetical protein